MTCSSIFEEPQENGATCFKRAVVNPCATAANYSAGGMFSQRIQHPGTHAGVHFLTFTYVCCQHGGTLRESDLLACRR